MRCTPALLLASLLSSPFLVAQEGSSPPPTPQNPPAPATGDKPAEKPTEKPGDKPQDPAPTLTLKESLAAYHPEEGIAKVGSYAEVKLGAGWLWLKSKDAQKFLREMGNLVDDSILGVALPPDHGDLGAFAVYTYDDEGHVDDGEEPDYAELLAQMQEETKASAKYRREAKLPTVDLLGWAEPPHYDKAQRKLYWAKKLQFEGNEKVTVNYNVRVLGRAGTLEINGVGDLDQLKEVAAHCQTLLAVTDFVDGQRYTDFNPSVDKVVAGGIGALIAGKLAMKAGIFAKLLKPLLVVLAVVGGAIAKLFAGRKKQESAPLVVRKPTPAKAAPGGDANG